MVDREFNFYLSSLLGERRTRYPNFRQEAGNVLSWNNRIHVYSRTASTSSDICSKSERFALLSFVDLHVMGDDIPNTTIKKTKRNERNGVGQENKNKRGRIGWRLE